MSGVGRTGTGRFGLSCAPPAQAGGVIKKKPASATSAPHRQSIDSAGPQKIYDVSIPNKLRMLLESWGPAMVKEVQACCAQWATGPGCRGVEVYRSVLFTRARVRVGTDCSGAEAPVWALRSMGIPHQHKFSCDWQAVVRDFIAAVCPPDGPIFHNMLTRQMPDIPEVDVYICGFPCTPFSYLRRHKTRLLRESAAKPFFKVRDVLRERQPPLAILENVLGIEKVMEQVCRVLRALGSYFVIVVKIDSKELGAPISRPRFYFILVRQDRAITDDVANLKSLGAAIMQSAKKQVQGTIVDLMLPAQPATSRRTACGQKSARCTGSQWQQKHTAFRKKHALPSGSSVAARDAKGPTNARQRDAWQLLQAANPGQDIIADISQNIDRARVTTNGVCPTICPNSVTWVKKAGRELSSFETLSAHFFPLHRMRIPVSVKPRTLATLGGNTMHLKSVGLAMCIGFAMLKTGVGESGSVRTGVEKLGKATVPDIIFLDTPSNTEEPATPASRKRTEPRMPIRMKRRRVSN